MTVLFLGFVVAKVVWVVACHVPWRLLGGWGGGGLVNFSFLLNPLSFSVLLYDFAVSSNNLEPGE